jgi:hypothetical protein
VDPATGEGVCEYKTDVACRTNYDCNDARLNTCCADHLEEQLFPVETLGKHYIGTKSFDRGLEDDYWRILAVEDGTKIETVPPQVPIPELNAGQWFEFGSREHFEILSDKPVMVGQFLASEQAPDPNLRDFEEPGDAGTGDPSFILAVPVEQFRPDFVFLVPDKYAYNYVSLIAPVTATIDFDNGPVPATFEPVGAGDVWQIARFPVGAACPLHSLRRTALDHRLRVRSVRLVRIPGWPEPRRHSGARAVKLLERPCAHRPGRSVPMRAIALLALLSALTLGCEGEPPTEDDRARCTGQVDENGDGRPDCADVGLLDPDDGVPLDPDDGVPLDAGPASDGSPPPPLADARVGTDDANVIVVPDAGEILQAFAINSVVPNRGIVAGGTPVRIIGTGFKNDVVFLFANRVRVPRSRRRESESRDVHDAACGPGRSRSTSSVSSPRVTRLPAPARWSRSQLTGRFHLFRHPSPSRRSRPNRIPLRGGVQLTIRGTGTRRGHGVHVGATEADVPSTSRRTSCGSLRPSARRGSRTSA